MNRILVNIIGRIDHNTGIAHHTKAFINCLAGAFDVNFIDTRPETSDYSALPSGAKLFTSYDPEVEKADVSIFVDVTSNGSNDENWKKVPATKRKYIYSVFDSTKIPLSWCDIINNHFDAVFVPAKFLVDVYRSSGVQKPIFYLPLAINIQSYLSMPTRGNAHKPFTFCFIGSREKRKNLDILITSFNEAFSARSDVQLRIHYALDFFNDPQYLERIKARYSNIIVTKGIIDDEAYQDIISSSDCFVSLSRGEGYSIVPREFLATGKPVILSNCFAHKEILEDLHAIGEGLAFDVDSSIPVKGVYDHINGGGIFGLQYDVYPPSVVEVLCDVFEKRHVLFTPEKIAARKLWAEKYSYNALEGLYRSIILPAFCRMSTGNELEFGGITTSDANLAKRITGQNFSLSGWQNVSNTPRKIVVIGNDGGFFSLFNRFVSYLTWTISENPSSIVLPDWRVDAIKRHWNKQNFTSFCYGKPEDGNIWLKLFKPLPYSNFSEQSYNSTNDLYHEAVLKDDYNENNEPWLTYVHPYKLYKSPGFMRRAMSMSSLSS